jgi:single-strand DNA-binding protein
VPERTEWHRVLLWRRLAEVVEKYVHSGDKLYIEGQLRTRSYTDKQGQTRYVTEIWADNMEMLTPKSSRSEVAPQSSTSASTDQPEDEKLPF